MTLMSYGESSTAAYLGLWLSIWWTMSIIQLLSMRFCKRATLGAPDIHELTYEKGAEMALHRDRR